MFISNYYEVDNSITEIIENTLGSIIKSLGSESYIILNSFYGKYISKLNEISNYISSNSVSSNSEFNSLNSDFIFKVHTSLISLIISFYENLKIAINYDDFYCVIDLIHNSFKFYNKVFSQGLMALNSIILACGDVYFIKYTDEFLRIVDSGLSDFNNVSNCYNTLFLIGIIPNSNYLNKLINSNEENSKYKSIVSTYVGKCIEILKACDVTNNEIKPLCIDIIGDFYMSYAHLMHESYFNESINIIDYAIKACFVNTKGIETSIDYYQSNIYSKEEEELCNYQLKLAYSIALCYNVILTQLRIHECSNVIEHKIESILNFMFKFSNRNDITPVRYLNIK